MSQAEQAIDKAATASNVVLSDEAKRVLAVEAVRQSAGASGSQPISDAQATKLVEALKESAQTSEMNRTEAEKRIVEAKVQEVTPGLVSVIRTLASVAKVILNAAVENSLRSDLVAQTEALARSGLSVEGIRNTNAGYVNAIYAAARQDRLDMAAYTRAQNQVFKRLVSLTIESVPPEANVQLAATSLGTTTIEKKPFEPGKSYQFIFSLERFKTSTREYYVSPAPVEQTLKEVLEPEEPVK